MEGARKAAIGYFEDDMFELNIDNNLFQGPILVTEDDTAFTFQWQLKILPKETSTIEISVPKNRTEIKGLHIGGTRNDIGYLGGTRKLPLSQAMLSTLFDTAPTLKDSSERARRLRMIPLDDTQLGDVANFLSIKMGLMQFSQCFNGRYPDSLKEIREYARGTYFMDALDSLCSHDRYGHEYNYINMITFVLIATPGKDGILNFNNTIIDSIYHDQMEHIYILGDDIIVKFAPRP